MRVFKLSFLFLTSALFIAGCNQSEVADRVYNGQTQPYEIGRVEGGFLEDDELIGRENLDLQALGGLLERANSAQDFEYLLNSEEGINNLDLNDDGYADYISVREFDDRYDGERGFSLFSMFGDNLIQEIAQVIFDRDGYDYDQYPGSRVLIRGNDYLYGDDYYYEANWLERDLPFIDWVFSDRGDYYRSPYYYQNYPSYYEPYQIVETPVYLTRIEQYYYSPVFVQTTQPAVTEIRIDSPYRDVSLSQAYMKVPKEQRDERRQKILVERNNQLAQFEREKPGRMKDFSVKENNEFKGNPNRAEKFDKPEKFDRQEDRVRNDRPQEMRDKPNKPERIDQPQQQQKFERQEQKQQQRAERQQQRFERPQQQRIERQQQRVERPQPQQQRVERQQQQQRRVERPQQVNQPRPQQQRQEVRQQPNNGGGNPNKGGGGNPNKGGGNQGGGGGGKGKGKP